VAKTLATDTSALGEHSPHVDLTLGRLELAEGDASSALARADDVLSRVAEDPVVTCAALDLRARALDFMGRRADAAAAWSELIDVAGAHGLTAERLRAVVTLSELELLSGEPPVKMYEAVELARASGALVEEAWAELNLSIALTVQGDPHGGAALALASVARCRERRLDLLPFLLVSCGGSHGFFDEVASKAYLDEAMALAGDSTDMQIHFHGVSGQHALEAGRYDEAIAHFEIGTEVTLAVPGGVPSDIPHWLVIAYVAAGRDDDAAAALKVARDTPDFDRWHSRSLVLTVGEALLARDADAFDAALASTTARMPMEIAVLRDIAANVIGGPARARWLRQALDAYEAAGATAMLDRLRGLLRDAGGAVPRGRGKGRVPAHLIAAGVTAREADVLALVAGGLSNADIAESLFLSVRTVESHVSSLLGKLGVESRRELADAMNP
jgi:ATP/maltotriose-dependent transcriptional regulator MalT